MSILGGKNMGLRTWSLALMILFITLFSVAVQGNESESIGPKAYEPSTMDKNNPNLLIGGIRQDSMDPNQNEGYKEMAYQLGAMYIPTYYSGPIDPNANDAAKKFEELSKEYGDSVQVNKAASCAKWYEATYQNGLKNPALQAKKYNTIVAYSGGTVSAVTALDKQEVKCHTLILISPMIGMAESTANGNYLDQIRRLLSSGAVQRIVVIQSENDKPPIAELSQPRFPEGKDKIPGVEINTVKLDVADGIQGHRAIFFEYAKDNLKLSKKNGRVYYEPSQPSETTSIASDERSLGMHEEQKPKPSAVTQERRDVFVIDSQFADEFLFDRKPIGFDEVLKRDPLNVEAWIEKGNNLQYGSEKYDEAIQCYEKAIEIDPENFIALRHMGYALNELGRTSEANAAFAKADEFLEKWLQKNTKGPLAINSGAYNTPSPRPNKHSEPSGTPPGIQEAVDNMLPAGEYNHYENTIPVFHQARL
jgi:tetratricopeptide (TPR) repeat protein